MNKTEDLQRSRSDRRKRAEPHALLAGILGITLAIGVPAACARTEGKAEEAPQVQESIGDPAELLAELRAAFEPVPLEATSDIHDRAFATQRDLLERLRTGDRALGMAALAAYRASEDDADSMRRAFLDVAAHCDPAGTSDLLAHMVVTYDVRAGLGLRTSAAELLADTAPERALEVLGPILASPTTNATLPPMETLVRSWARAARALETEDVRLLADLATDFTRPPDARYAAIDELGENGGPLAKKALEVLVQEAASDAYLRRKAAQAMVRCCTPEELCPVLERAAEHEHDDYFLRFLADMISKHCP